MKKITVLSGKGGVGKSSIAASLAIALSRHFSIVCADCDVDASNLALVLGVKKLMGKERIKTSKRAKIDLEKCNRCRKCLDNCAFQAIEWDDYPLVNKYLCEGCNTCSIVCSEDAIELVDVENATFGYARTKYGFKVVTAQLKTGESGSGKIVQYVKAKAASLGKGAELMIIDAAAGIGCPVIASVTGSDHVIAVTEPTPSGFSDLKRALKMIAHFGIPYSLVINKCDINLEIAGKIGHFAEEHQIPVLAQIPYDRSFVLALVNMTPIIIYNPDFKPFFDGIAEYIREDLT